MPEPGRKSRWKPWLIVFVSGIVLGGSSCAGFLSFGMKSDVILTGILAGGFVAGVAATLYAALRLLIQLILFIVAQISRSSS